MAQSGTINEHMYRSLLESQQLSHDDLTAYCDEQRLRTLIHAANTAPFYAKRLKAFRDSPTQIDDDDWNSIPVLTREDIRDHLDDIASNAVPKGHGSHHFGGTSGTSGLSILTKYTQLTSLMQNALQDRFCARMRFDGTRRLVSIKGDQIGAYPDGQVSENPWLARYVEPNSSAPFVQLKQPLALEKQLEFLGRQGPCYLNTQPSNLAGLALEFLSNKTQYANIEIAGVICLGELVQPYHRELAQEAFGCKIMDMYSATEVGYVAHACEHGHLHVNCEAFHVETLRPDGTACDAHETGRIVITSTINWAMPLIRYDIGDQGALSHGCACGINLPVLKMTVGRERNLFKFSDGTSVLGLLSLAKYHAFFPARQWQIAQTGPEELTIRFVSAAREDELDYDRLTSVLQDYFSRPLNVLFDRRDEMTLTASGKLQEAVRENG